ncbi:ComEC/Rec2 family competence protein [Hyalangium gracile]|uniref:ComEC/Rec2 family competence protein n=1 Tax=Hyalangium gracile TaxID=394092 RepID=UPI001CC9BA8F|nr:MBL fold metallo-hydrolase [Hyalangium gracile]
MNARLLPLLGLLLVAACKQEPPPPPAPAPAPRASATTHFLGSAPDGKLHVYFLDVGQGDSALIVSPEGRTVLVDAGPASAVNHLINRLPELLAARLDLVVLTHPAPDHYGAMEVVQKIANPRQLLEPQLPGNPPEYDTLLTTLGSQGVAIFSPAPNPSQPQELMRLPLGKDVELTVLWPRAPSHPLLAVQTSGNGMAAQHEANSIVLRLVHGKTSVIFAGDARSETEAALLNGGAELGSTLLKVAAHGADLATTEPFLQRVGPQAAIISLGEKHAPGQATLARLKAVNAQLFRTDVVGEVHAVSDGEKFVLTTQKLQAGESPNAEHVFVPEDKNALPFIALTPPPAPAKPEPAKPEVKPAAAKAVSAKAPDVDLSRFDKVVEVSPKRGEERAVRTGKKSRGSGELYYASRHKQIFHKATCPIVKKIHAENLVTYTSREDAMKERSPARDCNP